MRSWRKYFVFSSVYSTGSGSLRQLPVTKYNNAVKFALCVACGFCHTLDGECLHRLHEQDAYAVEHQRADDKNENEQPDVACE